MKKIKTWQMTCDATPVTPQDKANHDKCRRSPNALPPISAKGMKKPIATNTCTTKQISKKYQQPQSRNHRLGNHRLGKTPAPLTNNDATVPHNCSLPRMAVKTA